MTWLIFAISTAILYGFFDYFIKLTSGKVSDALATLIVDGIATLIATGYVIFLKFRGEQFMATKQGLTFAIIAGILTGLFSITFIKVFSAGANLTLGVLIVRVGMIIVSVSLAIGVLRESLTPIQMIGGALALVGLGLLMWK